MKDSIKGSNKDSNKDTSWEAVSAWYDTLLSGENTFQNKVILPHVLRLLEPVAGKKVLDIACGQGYFSFVLHQEGAEIVGIDASPSLIKLANEERDTNDKVKNKKTISFEIRKGDDLHGIDTESFDAAIIILAIQNIKNVGGVFAEAKRVLKKDGSMIMVLNHPSFRIPQHSDWIYREARGNMEAKQSRVIDTYISEKELEIIMNPGALIKDQKTTVSFHRPLQYFTKMLAKHGLGISRLEEWNSHRESEQGPRKEAEDKARKEIPMFMMIEVKKW